MLSYDVILWLKWLPHALLLAGVVAAAPLAQRGRIPWVRWTSYRERPVAMTDGRGSAGGRRSELPNIQVGSQENLRRLMLQDNQPWSRTSEPCPGRERLREEPRTGRENRECPVAMADRHSAASGSASEQGELQGGVGRSSRGARRGSASEQGELQGGVGRSSRGARSRSREGHGAASGRASEQGEHQGSVGRSSRRALSPSIDRQWDLCRECWDILSTSHIKAWIRENDSPTEIIYIIRLAAERLERMAGDGRFGSRS